MEIDRKEPLTSEALERRQLVGYCRMLQVRGCPRRMTPAERRPELRRRSLAGRALRLLRAAGVAGLSCETFYLVAMNVFLSTPLFEKAIDGTPLIVDIHYARGWSFFPTRIHARGLSIRGTDSHVEWILRFDEIDFDCSLLALAEQRFHVTRARGTGITFRARMKVASPAATPQHVGNLPPIDSLGPVAFMPSEPPSPAEWNDKLWHLWTVRIDDAIAEHGSRGSRSRAAALRGRSRHRTFPPEAHARRLASARRTWEVRSGTCRAGCPDRSRAPGREHRLRAHPLRPSLLRRHRPLPAPLAFRRRQDRDPRPRQSRSGSPGLRPASGKREDPTARRSHREGDSA